MTAFNGFQVENHTSEKFGAVQTVLDGFTKKHTKLDEQEKQQRTWMIRGSRHDQNTQYGIFKGVIQIILKPTTETKTSYKISLDEVGCLQSDMT